MSIINQSPTTNNASRLPNNNSLFSSKKREFFLIIAAITSFVIYNDFPDNALKFIFGNFVLLLMFYNKNIFIKPCEEKPKRHIILKNSTQRSKLCVAQYLSNTLFYYTLAAAYTIFFLHQIFNT
jgi:hypothetical protein